jgi:3-oxoacyl-[acyl-carrier protein] reductase
MDLGIADKRALVLAGGGGLGGASARALAAEGAVVAVADLNKDSAQIVADQIVAAGGRAVPYFCDLASLDSVRDLHHAVVADVGHPDIVVNITGGPPQAPAEGTAPEKWTAFFESMVRSVIFLTDLVLPAMKSAGRGRIITSSSSGVVAPIPDLAISNALRLSLLGWSKTLSKEVARDGITANVVIPGRIATQRVFSLDQARADAQPDLTLQDVIDASTSSIPVGRYGTVEEYAAVVLFLAGQPSSYITGSVLRVDGGLLSNVL